MSLINSIIVKTKVAPLYALSTFKSEMVSQALIWEKLKVLDKSGNWFQIKQSDGYISWIHNSYIDINKNIFLDIQEKFKNVESFSGWFFNYRSKCSYDKINNEIDLALGSCVPVFENNEGFHFRYPDGSAKSININKFFKQNEPIYDYPLNILDFANPELKTPYLWGGKSSFGYDCSGFVQSILKLYGINFPRDCSQQFESPLLNKVNLEESKEGDLIFFNEKNTVSHVGIYINKHDFMHSSGEVKISTVNSSSSNSHYSIELESKFCGLFRIKYGE